MDKGVEISEDLQKVTPIIKDLMQKYPASKKEAIRLEMLKASEHLAKRPFEHENAFEKQSLQEALNISQETMHIFYKSAYDFHQKGEFQKARSLFRFLTVLNPNHVDYWIGIGLSFFIEGRILDAQGAYEIARALDTTNPEAYFYIAKCLFMLGKHKEALKVVKDAENFSKRASNAPCLQSTLELERQIKTVMKKVNGEK